ncbi:MAG: DUF4160 domain-containing protein [Chloroflexi bacterium]|nr:DUF4160 domain-containing protein [Chloroflexota bacterium]MCC6894641.1 DUF4160 domain-containing protein [Anaerolineae bacterium]
MPTVLRVKGYRFIIFTNDHIPPHIHVQHAEGAAKVELDPIRIVEYYQLNRRQLNEIVLIIEENREFLLLKWQEFQGD